MTNGSITVLFTEGNSPAESIIHRDMPDGLEYFQEFAQRTYRYSDVQDIMEKAIPAIRKKQPAYAANKGSFRSRFATF